MVLFGDDRTYVTHGVVLDERPTHVFQYALTPIVAKCVVRALKLRQAADGSDRISFIDEVLLHHAGEHIFVAEVEPVHLPVPAQGVPLAFVIATHAVLTSQCGEDLLFRGHNSLTFTGPYSIGYDSYHSSCDIAAAMISSNAARNVEVDCAAGTIFESAKHLWIFSCPALVANA